MTVPAVRKFDATDFSGDDLYHKPHIPDIPAVGHFPMEFTCPLAEPVKMGRCTSDHCLSYLPHMLRKVVAGPAFNKCLPYRQKAWPEKTAIPQHHRREYRKGAPGAVFVTAAVSLDGDGQGHNTVADMKTFSGVDTMLAVVVRVAAGAEHRFGGSWLLQGANEYIHGGGCGPFPPFLSWKY